MQQAKRKWALMVGVGATVIFSARPAWALSTETVGNKELNVANYEEWPGLAELVNDSHRVYHRWTNGNESCYYRGTTGALNETLKKFASAKLERHQVIFLPGPVSVRSFHGQSIAYDWRLHMWGGIARAMARREADGIEVYDIHPTLYVYTSDHLDLHELEIPKKLTLLGIKQLRERYYAGIESGGQHARGYAAMFLAENDSHHRESATKITTLLDAQNSWLSAMALSAIMQFGANATHLVPRLEQHVPENENIAKQLRQVITAIQQSEDRSRRDLLQVGRFEQIETFLVDHR